MGCQIIEQSTNSRFKLALSLGLTTRSTLCVVYSKHTFSNAIYSDFSRFDLIFRLINDCSSLWWCGFMLIQLYSYSNIIKMTLLRLFHETTGVRDSIYRNLLKVKYDNAIHLPCIVCSIFLSGFFKLSASDIFFI